MDKLKVGELDSIREKTAEAMCLRRDNARARITVHMGTCGIAAGAGKIADAVRALHEKAEREDIAVTTSGCAGLCSREPMMTVELRDQAPVKYIDLDEEKTERIFREHLLNGEIVTEYALGIGSERLG